MTDFLHLAAFDLSGWRSVLDRVVERPWIALFELLLIGSVIYSVLHFLQGTRGARLVQAVLTILAISFAVVSTVADHFELDRINVLYPYFVFGVFLVSLVAFQTELRRILLRVGQGGWLQHWFRGPAFDVEPIVQAVERLAKKKIGALMALERGTRLGAVVESGVPLDAVATAELIETIFWPGTPLHDLGVIIRQGRVIAAGCQFPLIESGDVDRSLGSRHRAALGISHEVDAVVIVVSEETGTISLAVDGRLRRSLSLAALRDALQKAFGERKTVTRAATVAPVSPAESLKATPDGTGQVA